MNEIYGGITMTPTTNEEDISQFPSGVINLLVGICPKGEKNPLKFNGCKLSHIKMVIVHITKTIYLLTCIKP